MDEFDTIEFPHGFIEEWLTYHNLQFVRDYKVKEAKSGLTYFIPELALGVIVANWKRPLTISIINKGLRIYEKLSLSKLVILTNDISEIAQETIARVPEDILVMEISNLSEFAVLLNSRHQKSQLACMN